MNSNLLLLCALLTLSVISVGCDGGSSNEFQNASVAEQDAATARSLDASELKSGDTIFYTRDDNVAPFLSLLTLESGSITLNNNYYYEYTKSGEYFFQIKRRNNFDFSARMQFALNSILNGTASNSQLGSRFRELIHRDSPDFTSEELSEIASILNPSGTTLYLTSTGTLAASLEETFKHLVTSNYQDQRQGSMGGTYLIEAATSIEIIFQRPTNQQKQAYRLLTDKDWLPNVSGPSLRGEIFERGTWIMELINSSL